jgi:hypothetical protein
MLLEKYDASLGAAQADPRLATQLFLFYRAETAVAELYYAASRHVGCGDAKPGNVMARRNKSGVGYRLALIDFDVRFCARAPATSSARAEAPGKTDALSLIDAALAAFGRGDPAPRRVALRAALTAFVFCFVSAWQADEDAQNGRFAVFPYARTAAVLARHASSVMELVAREGTDEAQYRLVPRRPGRRDWTVRRAIEAYSNDTLTVETAMAFLARAAASDAAALLSACADEAVHYPAAYSSGVLRMAAETAEEAGLRFPRSASDAEILLWATGGEAPVAVPRMRLQRI